YGGEVGVGAPFGGAAGEVDLEERTGVVQVGDRRLVEHEEEFEGLLEDVGARVGDVGAGAVAGVDDAHELEGAEGFAEGGAADAEPLGQLALAGQAATRGEDRLEPSQD